MVTFRTLLLAGAALMSVVPRMVTATPRGAGSCIGGMAAVGASHLTATTLETGSLQDFGISLLLNGAALDTATTHDIPIGVAHTWELVASSNETAFRGFLLRLDGGTEGIDTTAALSGKGGRVKVAETVCVETEGVGGVTHTSRRLETEVSGSLRLDELSDDMNLDVTVVIRNRNDVSIFYYSAFVFRAIESTPVEMEVEEVDIPTDLEEEEADSPAELEEEVVDTAVEEEAETEGGEILEPETAEAETVAESTPSPTVAESTPSPTPLGEADDDDDDEGTDPTQLSVVATGAPTGVAIKPPTMEPMATSTPTAGTAAPSNMNEGGDDDEDIQMETQKEQEEETEENLQQTFPLLASISPACSRNNQCSVCQGDCNMDSDCEGELACFQRDEWDETPVPGCSGRGIMGRDYCFDPLLHPDGLREFDSECTESDPCGKCQGDCDGDAQCFGDLECFQRPGSSNMTVPGCIGLGSPGRDYCFNPSDLVATPETTAPTEASEPVQETEPMPEEEEPSFPLTEEVETTAPTEASEPVQEAEPMPEEEEPSFPLIEEVETPAPTDASESVQEDEAMNEEEEDTLDPVGEEEAAAVPTEPSEPVQEDEPMQEEQEEATGGGKNDEATLEPTTELTSELSLEPPSTTTAEAPLEDEFIESQMSLQLEESTCTLANPCGECEGDCDVDGDCEGDLECFARWEEDTNPVPGCSGEGFPGWDYCFLPALDVLRPRIVPCSAESPCKKCQADCDGDQDCQGNLRCFYRDGNDERDVPGCRGTPIANIDYCFDPNDLGERRALRKRAN